MRRRLYKRPRAALESLRYNLQPVTGAKTRRKKNYSTKMKVYSIVGNKKKVTMETNATRLKVVGNNCVIIVKYNHGHIEVIGNDCKVDVVENYGTINLVGGNGLVTISKRFKNDDVQMLGHSCHLLVDGKEKSAFDAAFTSQLSPFSKNLDDVIESIFTFVMR